MYADRLPRAARQLLTDLLVLAWVYAWVRAAMWLHDTVQKLAGPGRTLEGAGTGIADNLADAGGKVGRVPLVGDQLTAPFTQAAQAARSVADAGREQQALVADLAMWLPVGLLVVPLSLVLFGWLPRRLRWMRRAREAAVLRDAPAGNDLLALRALTNRPLRELAGVAPDVTQAWRRGDEATMAALAALELRGLGLRGRRR